MKKSQIAQIMQKQNYQTNPMDRGWAKRDSRTGEHPSGKITKRSQFETGSQKPGETEFYQTNPITFPAHFTPGGLKSALQWQITKPIPR